MMGRRFVSVCLLALFSVLLAGHDSIAQSDPCDPDPCSTIPNAVVETCTEIGGSCAGPSDFFCDCDSGYAWQDDTNTCIPSQGACDGVVHFPDSDLQLAIRDAIGIPFGFIYGTDLLGLTSLTAWGETISDLRGLECCIALTDLNLDHNIIVDVSPLAALTNLTYLNDNLDRLLTF